MLSRTLPLPMEEVKSFVAVAVKHDLNWPALPMNTRASINVGLRASHTNGRMESFSDGWLRVSEASTISLPVPHGRCRDFKAISQTPKTTFLASTASTQTVSPGRISSAAEVGGHGTSSNYFTLLT